MQSIVNYSLLFIAWFFIKAHCQSNLCAHGQFQCASGQCIDQGKYCDLKADCRDWSDEIDCGWCNFGPGLLCTWNSTGMKYGTKKNYGGDYNALMTNFEGHSGEWNFSLVSPKLEKTSTGCSLELAIIQSDKTPVEITVQSYINDEFVDHGKYKFFIPHTGMADYIGETVKSIHLGYMKKNSQVILNGVLHPSYNDPVFGFTNISFANCSMLKLPVSCDYKSSLNCAGWFEETKWDGRWQWTHKKFPGVEVHGYIFNDKPDLAEIRSSLITSPANGSCLSFEYMITGEKNTLHIHLDRYDLGKTINKIIWSAEGITINSTWVSQKLDINGNQEIDIGLISMATSGVTALKNLLFIEGSC